MKRKTIEVKFYVYEDEVITKEVNDAICKAIAKNRNCLENKYNTIAKFIGYTPDFADVLGTFHTLFIEEFISYVASFTFKFKDVGFEEEALKIIDNRMENIATSENLLAYAMYVVVKNTDTKYVREKLEFDRIAETIKYNFIDN